MVTTGAGAGKMTGADARITGRVAMPGVTLVWPGSTSVQPPLLHTATPPCTTATRSESATSTVNSVPRMPMRPIGVSSL